MIGRVRRAFGALAPGQRRVVLAAALVLGSMFLPWYSKSVNAITARGLDSDHESKVAILVPSFVEASIFLVAVAVLALMFARGEGKAFHLPFGDGIVVSAAGAWVGFLVFYRFIDQPAGGTTKTIAYSYDLSWGIFFGLVAAAFLIYAGTRLRLAQVPEPPLPGEGPGEAPTVVDRRPAPPTTPMPMPGAKRSRAEREAQRAAREARRRGDTGETAVVPVDAAPPTTRAPEAAPTERAPARPEIDGGTQLSFDEQE
jgi:hypothetical protein